MSRPWRAIHPKAAGAGLGGTFVVFVVACLRWAGVHVPDDVATSATGLVAFAGSWLARDRTQR